MSGVIIYLLFSAVSAWGQVRCGAEVAYKWEKEPGKEVSTPWIRLEHEGPEEAVVKGQLSQMLVMEKRKAAASCRTQHENLAGCISAKYDGLATTVQRMGFTARKSLEEAIVADCKSQAGKCLEATSSELACHAPAPKEGEQAEEGAKGKDAKGKDAKGKDAKGKK